jgi:hypothetical protein
VKSREPFEPFNELPIPTGRNLGLTDNPGDCDSSSLERFTKLPWPPRDMPVPAKC